MNENKYIIDIGNDLFILILIIIIFIGLFSSCQYENKIELKKLEIQNQIYKGEK